MDPQREEYDKISDRLEMLLNLYPDELTRNLRQNAEIITLQGKLNTLQEKLNTFHPQLQIGTEVMVYSRSQNKLCPARIIGLEGNLSQHLKARQDQKIGRGLVEVKYMSPCPPITKNVKISELRFKPSLLPSPPHLVNPCEGKDDGQKPTDCPTDRPVCKQNVCSVDESIVSRNMSGKRREINMLASHRRRRRLLRPVPPESRFRPARRLGHGRPAAIGEVEEEGEDMETEPDGQYTPFPVQAVVADQMEGEEERKEAAIEAFRVAINMFFLSSGYFGEEFVSVDNETLGRYSARDVANYNSEAENFYYNTDEESPWGRALFDRMWEEEVSRRIGERHAVDEPDEPGRAAAGFRRKSKKRKTRKKKSKKRKRSSRKSKTKRRRR